MLAGTGTRRLNGHHAVLGEHPVDIATEQTAVDADVEATGPAQMTPAAGNAGIDQDPGAGRIRGSFGSRDHLADHLVTHDPGVVDRDLAGQDLDVGAADSYLPNPNQDRAPCFGLGDVVDSYDTGLSDTDRSHKTPQKIREW